MNQESSNGEAQRLLPEKHGSALLRRLQNYRAIMSPEQKERHAGKLLLDATAEIERLIGICTSVHDRMLRGDDDVTLMQKLQEAWQGPNDQAQAQPPTATPERRGDNQ